MLIICFCNILTEFKKICASWKTDSWLWFRIFLTDMIMYQARNTCDVFIVCDKTPAALLSVVFIFSKVFYQFLLDYIKQY